MRSFQNLIILDFQSSACLCMAMQVKAQTVLPSVHSNSSGALQWKSQPMLSFSGTWKAERS